MVCAVSDERRCGEGALQLCFGLLSCCELIGSGVLYAGTEDAAIEVVIT